MILIIMRHLNNIIKTFAYSCTALAVISCYDDAYQVKLEELGAQEDEYILEVENGTLEVEYFTNLQGSVYFTEDVAWAKIHSDRFDGDGKLVVDYDYNSDFPRMASIVFSSDDLSRTDTIKIKQKGETVPEISFKQNNLTVFNSESGDTGSSMVILKTNVDYTDCDIDITYTGLKDDEIPVEWVKSTEYSNNQFIIETANNTLESLRNAVITLSYTNGWEELIEETLYLTQATKSNKLGVLASFEDVRAIVQPDEMGTIAEDIYIEGYIISDKTMGNTAENPMLTNTSIDYTRTEKCAYIESLDGKYGFLLECASVEDNNLNINTKVQILLKGADIENRTNPDRYTISGIKSPMIISSEKVSESIVPVKEKMISELTDDDIYTLVKLKKCEFPIRKGSLMPINEGYANACGANRISMFPSLIRDIEGNSMYMLTNSTCPYRRDGSKMGYGEGSVCGILVHEKYRRFIDGDSPDEDECGNIGRYQIRHRTKEDIAFGEDFKNSFSGIITEYRYMKTKAGGAWASTYGDDGEFRHTYTDEENPTAMTSKGNASFSYLGPVGNKADYIFGDNRGNENGFGIILEDGTDWGRDIPDDYVNWDGKGYSSASKSVAFANGYWWDDSTDRPYAWIVSFSTKSIDTDCLSLQLSMMNYARQAPSYWKIEWSDIDSMDPEDDKKWKEVAEFYIPDIVNWSPTQLWQSGGFKPMDFTLPLEMLGKSKVYVRIMPANKICSSDTSFGMGQLLTNGGATNAIDYFAVRYNK